MLINNYINLNNLRAKVIFFALFFCLFVNQIGIGKAVIAKVKIPTKITAEVLADTTGGTQKIFNVEKKPLGDIINSMMSKADETFAASKKLEMLEKGSAASKDMLTETAEEGLSAVTQTGVKSLRGKLSKEVLAETKEQLITLSVARTELMAKMDVILEKIPNLSQKASANVQKARNGLQSGLKQEDLVGALRDVFNKPVRESGSGKMWNHKQEVQNGVNSLESARKSIVDELKNYQPDSNEYKELSKGANSLSEMTLRIRRFLETK